MDQIVEEVEGFDDDAEHIQIVSSLTIQEIENMYTMEEETYLKKMMRSFYENWKAISFGPEIMEFYIDFCRNPKTLPGNYFTENNKVTRERLLNSICATEDMGLLSSNCQYNLLKRNIPIAELLLQIVGYHFTNEEDLIEFALGDKDLLHWKDRAAGAPWIPVEKLYSHYMPFAEDLRNALDKTMRFCFKPILHDRYVLALMVMMVTFNQGGSEFDPEVASLLSQYWTMLRRHLTNSMFEDVEETMSYLGNCLDMLPTLLEDNYDALVEVL
eukprot:TRINITY_DN4788_c0_g1_i1.p1 TRINITY_DN4788_c0_g1~~TRINITY_DN4788_c0_g1_i1.p1  ORF type:complete len:271 (-),score=57.40 TRINITY_DN4788_c0_g1_i1:126-938(-)